MHCLRIQRRNVRFSRLPGGVSESGYYAFDPAMNYRYRANHERRGSPGSEG